MPIAYQYRDLNLIFTANPIRHDISTLSNEDAVKRSVVNLVLTKYFERPFHPEIGCNATALLFENATPITAISLKRSIQDVVNNFEPRATLYDVVVNVSPDQNGYEISIYFYVNSVTTLQTVDLFLDRVR